LSFSGKEQRLLEKQQNGEEGPLQGQNIDVEGKELDGRGRR